MRYAVGYREDSCYAEVELGDEITVGAWGSSLLSAFSNAAKVARSVAADPVLSSILPPPIGPALQAANALATAAEQGKLRELLPRLRGEGARRLAQRLHEMRRRDLRDGRARDRYADRNVTVRRHEAP